MGWDPTKEYLEEFRKVVLGIHQRVPNIVKVAVIDDNLIGYCISNNQLHSYNGVVLDITLDSAYIWDMFIVHKYRSKGIGEKLLNETISYLKEIGKQRVFVIVNYWNEEGRKFFERNGFKLYGYFLNKEI